MDYFECMNQCLKPKVLAPGSEGYGLPGIWRFNVTLECGQVSLDWLCLWVEHPDLFSIIMMKQSLFSPKHIAMNHSIEPPTHWLSSILRVFSSWAERSFSCCSCCKVFLSSYPHLFSFESRSSKFACVISSCVPEAATDPKTLCRKPGNHRIFLTCSKMF